MRRSPPFAPPNRLATITLLHQGSAVQPRLRVVFRHWFPAVVIAALALGHVLAGGSNQECGAACHAPRPAAAR